MDNKDYVVIYKLRNDLTEEEENEIINYINIWKEKFSIIQLDKNTYGKNGYNLQSGDEFGSVAFFYFELEEKKEYFEKLEYYDYIDEEYERAI